MQNARPQRLKSQAKSAFRLSKLQHNASADDVLRPIRISRAPGLGISWSNNVVPRNHDLETLNNSLHPKNAQFHHDFQQLPKDQLRLIFVPEVAVNVLPKKVQRERAKRRWIAAFDKGLKDKGYDRQGRRLEPSTERQGLKGTLEILIHGTEGLTRTFEGMVRHATAVVEDIESRQRHQVQQPRQRQTRV